MMEANILRLASSRKGFCPRGLQLEGFLVAKNVLSNVHGVFLGIEKKKKK